ncbi:uncharacterized protein LOC122231828 isoform X2 [Panthera tigris]|uniref:uncharacterized protein LOC122231828 isoform X2 n=1 Tax=Panthera tigris TaxID=9694 RepID=UPI001C6F9892|nr:uncharacterized protein LOC122231828 isoform X2 [Panthera tigris]
MRGILIWNSFSPGLQCFCCTCLSPQMPFSSLSTNGSGPRHGDMMVNEPRGACLHWCHPPVLKTDKTEINFRLAHLEGRGSGSSPPGHIEPALGCSLAAGGLGHAAKGRSGSQHVEGQKPVGLEQQDCLPTPTSAVGPHRHQAMRSKVSGGGSANPKEKAESAKKPTRGEANIHATSALAGLNGAGASPRGHLEEGGDNASDAGWEQGC